MSPAHPRIVVVGDALLDRDWVGSATRLAPDAPTPVIDAPRMDIRPGGAALAALFAAGDGADVTLIAALGDDEAGALVRDELACSGITLVDLGLRGPTPEKIRIRAGEHSIARVDRGCSPVVPPTLWSTAATDAIDSADALLVSDYGRGMTSLGAARDVIESTAARAPVVWDPHPRGAPPIAGVDLATPNQGETAHFTGMAVDDVGTLVAASGALAREWQCVVAATGGSRGAVIAHPSRPPHIVPTHAVAGDTCGAGDRFAAAAIVARANGATHAAAVEHAVHRATEYVAGRRPKLTPLPAAAHGDGAQLAAEVRARGGVVVAAGGCFDLLHAGHVRTLQAARRLGDCLIVCLNSDASVRRLKGAGRPLNSQHDRATVLLGLDCVDAVVTFDADTPCDALAALRPHLFVKGGDYQGLRLPEEDVLAQWGGQLVVLPLVEGRSTTRLVAAAKSA